jgi:TRAP-type transport system small permease protein
MRESLAALLDAILKPLKALGLLVQKVEVAVISAIAGILVISTGWGVFSRYALDRPLPWPEEFGVFLYIWLSLVGSAVVLRRRKHIAIEFFSELMRPMLRTSVDLIVHALILFFLVILVQYSLIVMPNQQTLQFGASLRWPKSYLTLALVVAGLSMAMTCVQIILEDIRDLLRPTSRPTALREDKAAADI